MAVDTGMRSQELFRLYDDEVDLVEGMVYLGNYNPNRTKTGANRSFPLSERATQALQSLRTHWMTHKGPQWSGFYFENPKTGKPITSVKTAWKGICRRAGITDLHFHDLRHTFATWGLAAGVDETTLMSITGHKHPSSFKRYAHATKQSQASAVRKLEGFHSSSTRADDNQSTQ